MRAKNSIQIFAFLFAQKFPPFFPEKIYTFFYFSFSFLTLHREEQYKAHMHCPAGSFSGRFRRPFCQHIPIILVK